MKRTLIGMSLVLLTVVAGGLLLAEPVLAQDSTSQHLYKIYSNLGPTVGGNCYATNEAWAVGKGQSIAMPFTPKADAKLTVMTIALQWCLYQCGPNGGIVTLNEDNNGLPGNAIHTWKFKKLGQFIWHGCYLTGRRSAEGIELKKDTRYWLVAPTSRVSVDFWLYTYNYSKGDFAYKESNGDWILDDNYLGAFGLFGTRSE
jgi:hypothetical protein